MISPCIIRPSTAYDYEQYWIRGTARRHTTAQMGHRGLHNVQCRLSCLVTVVLCVCARSAGKWLAYSSVSVNPDLDRGAVFIDWEASSWWRRTMSTQVVHRSAYYTNPGYQQDASGGFEGPDVTSTRCRMSLNYDVI